MADIKTSTPTKAVRPPAAGGKPRRLPALLPLALGVSLLALGLPRLVSAVVLLPAESALDALQAERSVGDDELDVLARRVSIARRFSASGRIATDLAATRLAQADRLPSRALSERRILAEAAIALLEEALTAAPADSFAWSQLAHAHGLRGGFGPAAVDAWRMSVLTAPADRRLVLWRIRLGIPLTSRFIDTDHGLLDRQIRFAWYSDQEELTSYAKAAGPKAVETIRAALVNEPGALQRFDGLVRLNLRIPKKTRTGSSQGPG